MAFRRRSARQGNQVGFASIVQLAETVSLDPILQHAVQALVGVPPLDAVHRAFPHLQGRRYLWGFPSLVYLEQDAGAGNYPGRTLAAADQPVQPFPFLGAQLYRVSVPSHGCCTSPQSNVAVSVATPWLMPQVLLILV